MQIVARRPLRAFWEAHPLAEAPLRQWISKTAKAIWAGPADIRATFNSADFIADSRVIFNVGGNSYRLVVRISYEYRSVQVKFIGTHAEHDRINPETV
jgi:mRNA interferase HigB